MAINIQSESACRKAYINYHCYDNSMGITPEEMGQIKQKWANKIEIWQEEVSDDENQYDFSDEDYTDGKKNGEKVAKDAAGVDEGVGAGEYWKQGADIAFGAAEGAVVLTNGAKDVVNFATTKGGAKGSGEGTWFIICPTSLASAIKYMADRPNKENKEACDNLQNVMADNQAYLLECQADMEQSSEEATALSDEAAEYNEDANEEIEELKTEFEMYRETFLELKGKVESGESLTDSEKELYKESYDLMAATAPEITDISENTTDEVSDIYDDMATYQESFDMAADTMAEVEGTTDFAASIDEDTKNLCVMQGIAQTINAAAGAKAGYDAGRFAASGGWFTAWAWAFAAMGASSTVMSGIGAAEQIKWAGEVGTEIDMRKATQDLNTESLDMHDEYIDGYEGTMACVEEMTMQEPVEMELDEEFVDPGDPAEETGADAVPEVLTPKKNKIDNSIA